MVHTVQERRRGRWSAAGPASSQALISAGVLVAGIIGFVALVGSALAWNGSGITVLWALFGLAIAWFWLRRLAQAHLVPQRHVALDAPVAIRRDGTVIYRDMRRHERFVPARRATRLQLLDGREFAAKVIDLSIASVAVETRMSERDLSAVTQVGNHAAALIRQIPGGAVFGFDTLLDPRSMGGSFTL